MIKAIPYFENKIFCPVTNLKKWIDYLDIKSGKIFAISDKSVGLIIKKYASLSGLDANRYGGHSLRRYIQEANLFKNNALNKIKI